MLYCLKQKSQLIQSNAPKFAEYIIYLGYDPSSDFTRQLRRNLSCLSPTKWNPFDRGGKMGSDRPTLFKASHSLTAALIRTSARSELAAPLAHFARGALDRVGDRVEGACIGGRHGDAFDRKSAQYLRISTSGLEKVIQITLKSLARPVQSGGATLRKPSVRRR